jgi:hypothetical protein
MQAWIIIAILVITLALLTSTSSRRADREQHQEYTMHVYFTDGHYSENVARGNGQEIEETAEDWLCDSAIAYVQITSTNGYSKQFTPDDMTKNDGVYL